jgi:thioredoxin-related protein
MKKHLIQLFAFISLLFNTAHAQGIAFNEGSWAEIKAMAKAQNKLIFIDFYTDWCAPCKQMSMNVFPQKEVGDFYNEHFIPYKVNAEKGEGPVLAKQYRVAGYPTLAYINYEGEIIHSFTSSVDAKALIEHGKMAITPRNDYMQLKERFVRNELSKDELYRLFVIVKTKGDAKEADLVFDRYFQLVAGIDSTTFNLVAEEAMSTDSQPFKYIERNSAGFAAVLGADKVEGYIRSTYLKEFTNQVWYKSYKTLREYQSAKKLLKSNVNLTEQEELGFDTDFYLTAEDEHGFITSAQKLIERYYHDDPVKIGHLLGGGLRLVKDPNNLVIMRGFAERALSLEDNFINNATLAMVYKNLKNRHLALKYIDIAIAQCKRDNNGYEEKALSLRKEITDALQ